MGLAAAPIGWFPTGIVAMTVTQLVTAATAVCAEDAAVVAAAGASPAIATVAKTTLRGMNVMMFRLLT